MVVSMLSVLSGGEWSTYCSTWMTFYLSGFYDLGKTISVFSLLDTVEGTIITFLPYFMIKEPSSLEKNLLPP